MSLLPPNATTSEKNIEKAIDYDVNTSLLSGFKFQNSDQWLKLALLWEYSLAQIDIDDFQKRVLKGLEFHRIRGTPQSLRNALSWYNFDNIIIEEEPPGEHFAEFQIGLAEIPNDLVIDKLIDISKKAAPLRSRLTRMYNAEYDVRRFVLDESAWGNILSDNSGTRLTPDSPVLSFGRTNRYSVAVPEIAVEFHNRRQRFAFAINNDTYKLDWTILDESPNHILNNYFFRVPLRYAFNADSIVCDRLAHIFESQKIAKSLIVLSEDSELDDINSCFSGGYEKYDDESFVLSLSRLSEHPIKKENVLIAERKCRRDFAYAVNELEVTARQSVLNRIFCSTLVANDVGVITSSAQERCVSACYRGNDIWHDHRHSNAPWNQQSNYCKMI
jgi:P2-related tail formation protein